MSPVDDLDYGAPPPAPQNVSLWKAALLMLAAAIVAGAVVWLAEPRKPTAPRGEFNERGLSPNWDAIRDAQKYGPDDHAARLERINGYQKMLKGEK